MKELGQLIKFYRKKAGLKQSGLAEEIEKASGISITNKAISAWESGTTEPPATTFLYVCRILQIPDFMEAYFGDNPANPLSVLNDEGKSKVLDYIYQLANPISYRKELSTDNIADFYAEAEKVRKKAFYARVSAGTGDFLDSDEYTWIEVDKSIADKFDFAVTVHGDSMEPDFHDHDLVYIRQQNTLENGQIGIFDWNGDAYIKKYRSDETGTYLISLNDSKPEYAPKKIDVNNDVFRIFGRVVAKQ